MSGPVLLVSADPALLAYWQSVLEPGQWRSQSHWPTASDGATLVLLDLGLPDRPAWEQAAWATLTRAARVVAASTLPGDAEGLAAMQAGCVGYCHAYAAAASLNQVLAVVAAGGLWVGESLLGRLLAGVGTALAVAGVAERPDALVGLSEREREVALAAARGLNNKTIARDLAITERTVKAHLSSVFTKLGIEDRLQLALRVNGLL
ncbi:MAG: LuxR C-terminal-related transcriptional regulator [Rhodoferax sp.]